jgi:hypothetical protein
MEQQQKQTKQNKTKQNKTNKQKSNAAANYLFFLICSNNSTLPCTKKSFLGSVHFRVEDY